MVMDDGSTHDGQKQWRTKNLFPEWPAGKEKPGHCSKAMFRLDIKIKKYLLNFAHAHALILLM
jgi:hypothetical protein